MKNLEARPKEFPLTLILVGTLILAFPGAIGLYALFDPYFLPAEPAFGVWMVIGVGVFGFGLLAGYILTVIFRRHSRVLWLCSMLYNCGFSFLYLYLIAAGALSLVRTGENPLAVLPALLIPCWTIFVTVASGYYFRFAVRQKKVDLL